MALGGMQAGDKVMQRLPEPREGSVVCQESAKAAVRFVSRACLSLRSFMAGWVSKRGRIKKAMAFSRVTGREVGGIDTVAIVVRSRGVNTDVDGFVKWIDRRCT